MERPKVTSTKAPTNSKSVAASKDGITSTINNMLSNVNMGEVAKVAAVGGAVVFAGPPIVVAVAAATTTAVATTAAASVAIARTVAATATLAVAAISVVACVHGVAVAAELENDPSSGRPGGRAMLQLGGPTSNSRAERRANLLRY